MMKFREMSLWYKLSIIAAALVGGVVTRYAALVIMAGGHFGHRESRVDRELMKSSYMILEPELSPAEVDGLREVTRYAPAKSGISKKVRDRLVTFGYIEQRIGRLIPTAKGILYLARHRREHLRISHLIRSHGCETFALASLGDAGGHKENVLTDEQIAQAWAKHYPQHRAEKVSEHVCRLICLCIDYGVIGEISGGDTATRLDHVLACMRIQKKEFDPTDL